VPASNAYIATHLLACSILWASGFVFLKMTAGAMSPIAIAAARGFIAALALAMWFALIRRSIMPQGREWRDWIVLGTLNGWGPNMLTAYALTQVTTGLAALLQAAGPIMVAVLAHLIFVEERLSPRRGLGVLIGFGGMAILIGPAALPGYEGVSLPGALAMVATAACYSAGSIYVRAIPQAQPLRLALGQQMFSAIGAIAITLVVLGPVALAPVMDNLPPLIALGVLATALPIFLFMRLVRAAGPTRASMTGYLLPVWAALFGYLIFGETLGLRELAGGLVILAGVALVSGRNPLPAAAVKPRGG
jgi:drug/metabolite transporter (DMT)-like permease